MTYQVVATTGTTELDSDYDPNDEAEIERLRKRGYGDGALLDEASGFIGDLDPSEYERIRSEIAGSYE